MSSARVLVVMPTRGYAYVPSLLRALALARQFQHELVLEIGHPIELVRTRLAARFLESNADHLLTIDDDIIAPDGAAEQLLALGAAVATAPYPIGLDGQLVASVKAIGSEEWLKAPRRQVFPVRHTGLGFTLIRRDVFAQIRKPWFQFGAADGGRMVGEDTWFCNGVTQAGLEIVCDGALGCSHFKDGMDLMKLVRW